MREKINILLPKRFERNEDSLRARMREREIDTARNKTEIETEIEEKSRLETQPR